MSLEVCPPSTPLGLGMMPLVDTDARGSPLDSAAFAQQTGSEQLFAKPSQSPGALGGHKGSMGPCPPQSYSRVKHHIEAQAGGSA